MLTLVLALKLGSNQIHIEEINDFLVAKKTSSFDIFLVIICI